MGELTALIDGDTIAFRAASAVQHVQETPDGTFEPFAQRHEGEAAVDNMIQSIHDRLRATHIKVFLSCPADENWRLKVDPNYKSNRSGSVRPFLLKPLKDYLRHRYGAEHFAFLEADDAIGIHATGDTVPGPKIIVGKDKDFWTIPGDHYQLDDDLPNGKPNIVSVTPMEAAHAHYAQALSGDLVDGYEGCPTIGKKRAAEIVANPELLVPKDGVVTRGPRKGEKVTKWHSSGPSSIWEAVVSNYEKQGLTEADALRNARLARILLAGDYDFETHTVTLWVPGKE